MIKNTKITFNQSYAYGHLTYTRPDEEFCEDEKNSYISDTKLYAHRKIFETLKEIFKHNIDHVVDVDVNSTVIDIKTNIIKERHLQDIPEYRFSISLSLQTIVELRLKDDNIETYNHLKLKYPNLAEIWSCITSDNMGIYHRVSFLKNIFTPITEVFRSV